MPTGSEIKIDTAKMASAAQTVKNQISIINSCFSYIRGEALSLKGQIWEGASADAYHENMKKLCGERPSSGAISTGYVVKALEEYVLDLNSAASEFNTLESNAEIRVKALPTDIFGV